MIVSALIVGALIVGAQIVGTQIGSARDEKPRTWNVGVLPRASER
jgi:hypothetical protein